MARLYLLPSALILFLSTLLGIPLVVDAQINNQTKYEKEYRLDTSEVPKQVIKFVEPESLDTKVKWYYEVNNTGHSIEAKFKLQGSWYSIEFDTLGTLQDIEVEYKYSKLSKLLRERIDNQLKETFTKHKIKKLQISYTDSIQSFSQFIKLKRPRSLHQHGYEIVVKGKKSDSWALYELFFDSKGNKETISKIILDSSQHLVF